STSDSCGAIAPRKSRVEAPWRKGYSHGHQAAIGPQIHSTDVAALFRSEEHRCRSNLLRLPDAPHRNHRLEPFLHRICVLAKLTFENRCLDGAGADYIRADSFACELRGPCAHERAQGRLSSCVSRIHRDTFLPGPGTVHDDRSAVF